MPKSLSLLRRLRRSNRQSRAHSDTFPLSNRRTLRSVFFSQDCTLSLLSAENPFRAISARNSASFSGSVRSRFSRTGLGIEAPNLFYPRREQHSSREEMPTLFKFDVRYAKNKTLRVNKG